jgi:uncharacterized protein YqeY
MDINVQYRTTEAEQRRRLIATGISQSSYDDYNFDLTKLSVAQREVLVTGIQYAANNYWIQCQEYYRITLYKYTLTLNPFKPNISTLSHSEIVYDKELTPDEIITEVAKMNSQRNDVYTQFKQLNERAKLLQEAKTEVAAEIRKELEAEYTPITNKLEAIRNLIADKSRVRTAQIKQIIG